MQFTALVIAASWMGLGFGLTIIPGGDPKPYAGNASLTSVTQLFRESVPNEFFNNSAQVLMTSYNSEKLSPLAGIRPSGDSFVRGAIQAWGEHLHLVIRPEEVWFTILVQMNFYMNAHAEELRSMFVDWNGQQVISIEDYTWYAVLGQFKDEIQKRVKTDWLLNWIMPNFTTTTEADVMTANVLMMGLTKAYFKFEGTVICGLPSVTLLGELSDWEALLAKLDRLPSFGSEPDQYKARLKPILSRFVTSFKQPDSTATRTFWNQIVSAKRGTICGDPPFYMSGWITGFYFWDDKGKMYPSRKGNLTLDGITYNSMDLTQDTPVGYATVPFVMHNFNDTESYEAMVLAGTVGKKIVSGAPDGYQDAVRRVLGGVQAYNESSHSTLQPLSGWMLYGPVVHNVTTTKRWQPETEVSQLTKAIQGFYNEATCLVK
jgi:hypothetical protein